MAAGAREGKSVLEKEAKLCGVILRGVGGEWGDRRNERQIKKTGGG